MYGRPLAALLALALVTAATSSARAEEGEKEKDKDSVAAAETRYPPFSNRFKVLAAGVAITGAAWGVTFAASRGWPERTCIVGAAYAYVPGSVSPTNPLGTPCASGPPGSSQLGIPIVGPWIALGKSGCASDEPTCSVAKPILRGIAYGIDGVVQLAGLGLIVEALVMKTEPSGSEPAKKSSPLALHFHGLEMTPLPVVTPSMSGIGVIGTF